MSHFTVGVLVPTAVSSLSEADEAITGPLAPFNEQLSDRVKQYADAEGEARMLRHYRKEALRAALEASGQDVIVEALTDEALKQRLDMAGVSLSRADLAAKAADWFGADEDEDECGLDEGGIWYMSSYNDDGKWDWYEIGGRWSGMMEDANWMPAATVLERIDALSEARERYVAASREQDATIEVFLATRAIAEGRPVTTGEELRTDIAGVKWALKMGGLKDIPEEASDLLRLAISNEDAEAVSALVTIDGNWVEKGQMGWWAMTSGEKGEGDWLGETRRIIEEAVAASPDATLVLVDCHV